MIIPACGSKACTSPDDEAKGETDGQAGPSGRSDLPSHLPPYLWGGQYKERQRELDSL